MDRRRRAHGAVVGGIVALVAVAQVRAVHADDLVPVRLAYEGPAGCPDGDAFSREVLARAPRARLATSGERSRTLMARVGAAPAGGRGYDGVLEVRDAGATATERAVHAPSCNELVTALAVIAAVVIDPITARTGAIDAGATTPPAGADGGTAASAPAGSPEGGTTTTAPTAPTTPTATAEAPVTEPAPPVRRGAAEGVERRERWEVSAGAGGGAISGSAPTLLFSVPVFFEVARTGGGVVQPALRVRFERTATAPADDGAFSRTGGAVDLCPLALRARSLRAQPCARVELAALYARGRDVEPVRSDVRPWFAFGPIGRVRLELAAPLFLELEGGLLLAVVRDRFFVEPGTLVYRAPLVGATTAFSMGLAF